jgi:hypothetical protein
MGSKPANQAVVDGFVWWEKAAELLVCVEPYDARHRRETMITIKKRRCE